MNTQMGSALPSEKLDRNNFASWEYKMHQYLVGQGYWTNIKGAHEDQPGLTTPEYATWEQATLSGYYASACRNEAGPRGSRTEEQAREEKERAPITQDRGLHRDTALQHRGRE